MKTMMQTTRWNRRRLAILACSLLIFYMIFSASRKTYQSDAIIKNTKPEAVWEYIADFHKMRLLNPTILDFTITKDEGHLNHWRYSVVYKERLQYWPYWINVADADFEVRKLDSDEDGQYLVSSNHKTCFAAGLYCLYSTGEFRLSAIGSDTLCVESITYQCPPFFGGVCRREVEFQREAIMRNLKIIFNKKRE